MSGPWLHDAGFLQKSTTEAGDLLAAGAAVAFEDDVVGEVRSSALEGIESRAERLEVFEQDVADTEEVVQYRAHLLAGEPVAGGEDPDEVTNSGLVEEDLRAAREGGVDCLSNLPIIR